MPPKRKAPLTPSASQPLPDTRATRTTGRKRRHSDASNVSNASERPSSRQGPSAPAKRRKRGRSAAASAEPEVIVEEQEQEEALSAHHQEEMNMQLGGGDATDERDMMVEDSIEVSKPRSKHVHFGGAAHDDNEEHTSTATNITPHPRKMTVKRRFTMSPSVGASSNKRIASGSRTSLPPAWSQDSTSDPTKIIQELQFAPLRAVLDERVKRRLRRSHLSEEQIAIEDHVKADKRTSLELDQLRQEAAEKEQRIEELSYDLETQRQLAIDVTDDVDAQQHVLSLERDLEETRRELADHMEEHRLGGDLDEDMLVFDSQEEIVAYPQLPPARSVDVEMNGTRPSADIDAKSTLREISKTTGRASLSVSKLTADWDAERRKFEDAILALSREAGDAKADLQVLQIELEALGFGGDGVSSKVILDSIRQSFASIRENIESILPDTLPEDASTQDVIEILIANVKEFADRLRLQDQELYEKNTLIADLTRQIEGLLEHLAEAEIKYKKLQEHWDQLDKSSDEQARTIEELEETLDAVEAERNSLRQQVAERTQEAKALGVDHAESVKSIESLTLSLERYRDEETRLTELITRMEQEHRDGNMKMSQEREETVQDFENRLDAEIALRGEAEGLADDRQTEITQLDLQIEQVSTERDALREELDMIKAERDLEKEGRQTAEDTLEERTVEVEDLTARVDRLEEELNILNSQLDELRKLNETERRQREAAEQDLDDRNAELDELKKSLDAQGQEANKLRMKLFEVQTQNDKKVKEFEQQSSERDEQYQTDIAYEVARREAADDLAQQRAATILELETRVEEIELNMRNDIAERDERVEELEADLAQRENEIEDLKIDLRSAEKTIDNERAEKEERVEQLEGSILALQETVSQHEAAIQQLQQQAINDTELHNSEIDDRNGEIADLHAQITKLRDSVAELEKQKAGLEKRVEQEAEDMLELQALKEDEIESYKNQLKDKQDKILVVEAKAVEADRRWQEVLAHREEEIEELNNSATGTEEVITTLTTDFEAMRQLFRDYVARSTATINKLQAAVLTAKTVADDEGDALKEEGLAALQEVEGYNLQGKLEVMRTTTRTVTQAVGGAAHKGRGRKSRRVMDSGIGMDGEAEEMAA